MIDIKIFLKRKMDLGTICICLFWISRSVGINHYNTVQFGYNFVVVDYTGSLKKCPIGKMVITTFKLIQKAKAGVVLEFRILATLPKNR